MTRRSVLAAVVFALGLLMAGGRAVGHADLNAAINAYRVASGLTPLPESTLLEAVAHQRAVEVGTTTYRSHVDLTARLGCWRWGEIIAWRTTGYESPAYYVAAWAGSPPHNAIMLGDWAVIGSGTYLAADGFTYAVALFLTPCIPIVEEIPDTAMGRP